MTTASDLFTGFPFSVAGLASSWATDSSSRQQALDFGRLHVEGMASLRRIGAAHGGGRHGMIVGVIEGLVAAGIITAADRVRLIELFEAFLEKDPAKAIAAIKAVHAAAVADPDASPAALAVSSVAVAVIEPATDSNLVDGVLIGYADATGSLVGTAGGPAGAASTGIQASMLAEHLTGH